MNKNKKDKYLFVCTQNRWRSLTAEVIFKNDFCIEARSAGTSNNARHQVTQSDVEWADKIFCMENRHKEQLREMFPQTKLPPIEVLDIDSGYRYMDEELITMLRDRIGECE